MIHWEQSSDKDGFDTWLRYVECSHWGLFFTVELPRWYYCGQPTWRTAAHT
jgi:hypothetical protein